MMAAGLFPPDAMCICGCRGKEHETVWEGDEFKGTRCEAHGGHKFALGPSNTLTELGGKDYPLDDGLAPLPIVDDSRAARGWR